MTERPEAAARPPLPWHPVAFAIVVVLTAWLDAAVSPFAALRSFGVAVIVALLLVGVSAAVLRSLQLGAVVASALIGLAWSKQLLATATGIMLRMGALSIVWVLLIVAVGVLAVRMVRRRAGSTNARMGLTTILNRAAGLLLVATLGLGLVRGNLGAVVEDLGQGMPLEAWSGSSPGTPDEPDLFVILLDGYPRADVLEYAFDLDNDEFVSALEERGFSVADASHSDYLWTHLSVPSALNMEFVERIPGFEAVADGAAPRQPTLRRTIADNAAFDLAREHGYAAVAVGAGFEEVAPRLADVYVDGGQLNEFEISLLASTFAGDLVALLAPDFASGQLRDRILFNLDVLGDIAAERDRPPALVFGHVPAPHQPVVFGSDGSAVAVPLSDAFFADSPMERGEDPGQFHDRYRAQLPFLNARILEAVDRILTEAAVPPVIVLFADHGSASAVDWNETDPADAAPARVLERTGTLFAALTPGREGVFPADISPVDIIRLLSDAYLGTDNGRAVSAPRWRPRAPGRRIGAGPRRLKSAIV